MVENLSSKGERRSCSKLLLVEDEAAIRNLITPTLRRLGYEVMEAACGKDALAMWNEKKTDINLVLVDLHLEDGIDGDELATRFRKDRPDVSVIYASGCLVDPSDPRIEAKGFCLQKPYSLDELEYIVRLADACRFSE